MTPYYQDESVTIYHGENGEILPALDRVDHVITDPPYSEHTHAKQRRGGGDLPLAGEGRRTRAGISRVRELGFGALDQETRAIASEQFARLARRWVMVFSDVESCHLWREDLIENGLDYARTAAWRKLGSAPQFTGDRPATSFETITIAHPKGRKKWNGGGKHGWWQYEDEAPPGPVYEVPIVLNRSGTEPRLHTTQKPLALMTALIEDFTDRGETVLDPFMGSGTTLRAAKDLGRRAIGIEIEERYCEIAAKRMAQGVLFGAEGVAR
jgi:site-specific DNA-methyltransferase (adenine-specific)